MSEKKGKPQNRALVSACLPSAQWAAESRGGPWPKVQRTHQGQPELLQVHHGAIPTAFHRAQPRWGQRWATASLPPLGSQHVYTEQQSTLRAWFILQRLVVSRENNMGPLGESLCEGAQCGQGRQPAFCPSLTPCDLRQITSPLTASLAGKWR